jgi:uncharacterized membrane protein YfcA
LDIWSLIALGAAAGAGAGLLAGLIGIGGGIVVVPVVYYGLLSSGVPPDEAVHVAVATSLAAILPAAIVSFLAHRRAGNTDCAFLCEWGPGIATGVVAAQFAAPHVRGSLMTATFALLCLVFAVRLRFRSAFVRWPSDRRAAQFDISQAPASGSPLDSPGSAAAS